MFVTEIKKIGRRPFSLKNWTDVEIKLYNNIKSNGCVVHTAQNILFIYCKFIVKFLTLIKKFYSILLITDF